MDNLKNKLNEKDKEIERLKIIRIDCKTCDKFQKTVLRIKEFTDAKEQEIKDDRDKEWREKIEKRIKELKKQLEDNKEELMCSEISERMAINGIITTLKSLLLNKYT